MRIENKLAFVASVLAFVGTIVIVMDRFGPIHRTVDHLPKWQNIAIAMADLDTFDTKIRDEKEVGMLEQGKPGFRELVHIILKNRPELREQRIVAVVKNQPIAVGGVPIKIVHVAIEGNPQGLTITTDYIFHEWIRDYRDKYFLKIGLTIIAISFLVSVFAHIKWKTRKTT
jgi:hypothetical protein